jgi:hypothetical protein
MHLFLMSKVSFLSLDGLRFYQLNYGENMLCWRVVLSKYANAIRWSLPFQNTLIMRTCVARRLQNLDNGTFYHSDGAQAVLSWLKPRSTLSMCLLLGSKCRSQTQYVLCILKITSFTTYVSCLSRCEIPTSKFCL